MSATHTGAADAKRLFALSADDANAASAAAKAGDMARARMLMSSADDLFRIGSRRLGEYLDSISEQATA